MKAVLESKTAWLSSNQIGGKVAGDTTNKALAAILISLVCIVGYIWIRFQRVIFGLSAVVAWYFFGKATKDLKETEGKILNEAKLSFEDLALRLSSATTFPIDSCTSQGVRPRRPAQF